MKHSRVSEQQIIGILKGHCQIKSAWSSLPIPFWRFQGTKAALSGLDQTSTDDKAGSTTRKF